MQKTISDTEEYDALDYQLAKLLAQLNNEGNTLLQQATLQISKQTREGRISLAYDDPKLIEELLKNKVVGLGEDYTPLTIDNGCLYLRRYWCYQQRLAAQINSRLCTSQNNQKNDDDRDWITQRLTHYFGQDNEANNDETNWQQIAAALALSSRFLIISGGPGTGKTTTITRILALLIEQHQQTNQQPLRISLAAPTGKAAMRMRESIRESIQRDGDRFSAEIQQQLPQESSTLHRLLGYLPNSTEFRFNASNHLTSDLIIVDEASMIDLALMTKLFEATSPQTNIILLGDKDQLSSVETGSVFADLCSVATHQYQAETLQYLHAVTGMCLTKATRSTAIDNHIVCLLKNWRFNQSSGIGQLATAVNQGDAEQTLTILAKQDSGEIQLIPPAELTVTQLTSPWQTYLQALTAKVPITDLFSAFNHFRILSALRRGMNGSLALNIQLEKKLLEQKRLDTGKRWYHGRPIMITENSYRTGLFNGDIGITLLDNKGQANVWFQTSEGEKSFSPVRLPQHETAWIMTIHKSQGSEFERVMLMMPTEDSPVLTQKLIYTGMTRAKKRLEIVSHAAILQLGIEREIPQATQIRSALEKERIQ
jgi:exodeoxyribonuclease V alpha subunit